MTALLLVYGQTLPYCVWYLEFLFLLRKASQMSFPYNCMFIELYILSHFNTNRNTKVCYEKCHYHRYLHESIQRKEF